MQKMFKRICAEKHQEKCLKNKLSVLKMSFYFLGSADFERMNEIPSSTNIGKKTTKIDKQNAFCWSLTKVSGLEVLLKRHYFGRICVKGNVNSITDLEKEMRGILK